MKPAIDIHLARKLAAVIAKGLREGTGSRPGELCVEQAVDFVTNFRKRFNDDEPSDKPIHCVSDAIIGDMIFLNDQGVFDDEFDRASKLLRPAIGQLGSDKITRAQWDRAMERAVEKICPRYAQTFDQRLIEFSDEHGYEKLFEHFRKLARTRGGKKTVLAILNSDFDDWDDDLPGNDAALILDFYASQDREDGGSICAEIIVEALRICKSPGIKLMDRLIKEGVI